MTLKQRQRQLLLDSKHCFIYSHSIKLLIHKQRLMQIEVKIRDYVASICVPFKDKKPSCR